MQLDETFTVEDGFLVRVVVPARGAPYRHARPAAVFEAVAHEVDGLGAEPFSLEVLRQRTGLPWTQVNTALAFMKERGCVVPCFRRRHQAASTFMFEDAMTEFHALREGDSA